MFDLDTITRTIYIDELKQFKESFLKNLFSSYSNSTIDEIEILNRNFEKETKSLSFEEFSPLLDEFRYNLSLKKLSEYRLLSALYIVLSSIWELQVNDYNQNSVQKYYNGIITSFLHVSNLLKHGRNKKHVKGKTSYQKLKEMDSKYLESSYYFKDIIEHLHGGEILNISLEDLKAICDEMIRIWSSLETKEPNI